MKKFFLSITLYGLGFIGAQAVEKTNLSAYENLVYVEDATAAIGSQATLSLQMNNNVEIVGYQCDVHLPSGITFVSEDGFYSIALSTERTTSKKTNYFGSEMQDNGCIRILCGTSAQNTATGQLYTFGGQSGEVATIVVEVGNNVAPGEYPITLKGIVLSDPNNGTIEINEDIVTVLTVTDDKPSYDEGYGLSIAPFSAAASTNYETVINFNCQDEIVTGMEFDVVLPTGVSVTKSGRANKQPVFCNDDRIYVDDHSINMTAVNTTYHIVVLPKVDDEYKYIAGTTGSLITLYLTTAADIAAGICNLSIDNIVLTTDDGSLNPAPYAASIFVGDIPVADSYDFSGDYSSPEAFTLLSGVLNNGNEASVIDLTGVTALPASTTIPTANPNALILTSTDLGLANTANVVIDGECAQLALTENYDFQSPVSFTASSVQYVRGGSNEWGTLCVPYAISSDSEVQLYKLSSVSSDVLNFTAVASVEANEPCVFRRGGSTCDLSQSGQIQIAATPANIQTSTEAGWTMHGSQKAQTLDVNGAEAGQHIYYISNNKFWYCTGTVNVKPFCAYFTASSAMGASFRIADEETGISHVSAEAADGVLYDLQGRQVSKPVSGEVYVLNGMKVSFK